MKLSGDIIWGLKLRPIRSWKDILSSVVLMPIPRGPPQMFLCSQIVEKLVIQTNFLQLKGSHTVLSAVNGCPVGLVCGKVK